MGHKKRHHILPQRYQRGVADSHGFVWYRDERRGEIASEVPLNVAVEKHFYSSEFPTSANPAAMEDFLAEHVESPFWPVLEKLEREEITDNMPVDRIAIFAAFLLTRIAVFRNTLNKILGQAMVSSNNLHKTISSIEGLLKVSSGGLFFPAMPKHNALNQMGRIGIEASQMLLKKNLHVMYSPADEPFITTDNPFVFEQLVRIDEPPSIAADSYMKLVPLSAKVAIGFGLPGNTILASRMKAIQVSNLNVRLATVADQIVISQSKQQLEQILKRVPKRNAESPLQFPTSLPPQLIVT